MGIMGIRKGHNRLDTQRFPTCVGGPHTAGLKQLRGKKARPFFPRFCDGPPVLLNASLRWRLAGDDARSRISVHHKPRDAGKPPSMALTVAVFFGLT